MTQTDAKIIVENIQTDPLASNWLKYALESSVKRDPVDALNEAEFLVEILKALMPESLSGPGGILEYEDGAEDKSCGS